MLALLSCIMLSKRPIFGFPGFMASNLYATITDLSKFPNCSGVIEESVKTQLWPTSTGQVDQCSSDLLDVAIVDGKIQSPEGVKIESDDIVQTTEGVEYLIGYENAFKVPYDWIHFYIGTEDVFVNLKKKIEEEVKKTGLKAVITGYSNGGNAMRRFLTHFVDDEWKNKYIAGACFLAAAMGGSFTAAEAIYYSKMYDLDSPFVKHMPCLFSLFPNFPINENIATINGKPLAASGIYDFLKLSGKTDEITDALYKEMLPYMEEEIKDPNVPSLVAFNTAIDAICGIDIDGDNTTYRYCGGDAIVSSPASEYAGSHWKDVKIYNFNNTDEDYDHSHLEKNLEMRSVVSAFIENLEEPVETLTAIMTETLVVPTEQASVPIEPATAEVPVITETAVVTEKPATATKEVTTPTAEIATTVPENTEEGFWTSEKAIFVYCGAGALVIVCVIVVVIRRRRSVNGQSDSTWRDPLLYAIDNDLIEK